VRRGRTERVVAQGFRTSSAKAPPAVGRLVRNLVMPWVPRRRDPQSWMRDHHLAWDDPADAPVPRG
jgi:hypothetical protein